MLVGSMLVGSMLAGIAFSWARLGNVHAMSHPASVINRGEEEAIYTADGSAAGLGAISGSIAPMSAETLRLV